jgi:hypothetical protein
MQEAISKPWPRALLRRCRIDNVVNFRHFVGRKTAQASVLLYQFFIGRDVHAKKFVVGNVALQPLNGRAKTFQHAIRFGRRIFKIVCSQLADAGHIAFNYILWHCHFLVNVATNVTAHHCNIADTQLLSEVLSRSKAQRHTSNLDTF